MLKEYDSVRLKKRLSVDTVPLGSDGVVLMVYKEPTLGYEVEFFDESHSSLGSFSTTEDHLEKRTDCFPQVGVADYVRLMKDFLDHRIDVHGAVAPKERVRVAEAAGRIGLPDYLSNVIYPEGHTECATG